MCQSDLTVSGSRIHDNGGYGVVCVHGGYYARTFSTITSNEIYRNANHGVSCSRYNISYNNDRMAAEITLNDIYENGGYGTFLQTTETAAVLFNNIHGNTNTELYNGTSHAVDARHNYWGDTVTVQMEASAGYANISEIHDIFDDETIGLVDYIPWKGASIDTSLESISKISDPTNGSTLNSSTVVIRGTAYAKEGVERVEVSIDDGVSWQTADGSRMWSFTFEGLAEGEHIARCRVVDDLGQTEAEGDSIAFSVDYDRTTTAGVLPGNEIWSGMIKLEGDVTIPEDVTLTILAGATIEAPALVDATHGGANTSKTELIVNGNVIAEGTEESPIFFISDRVGSSQKGDWYGIRSFGTLWLNHVSIEGAVVGVRHEADQNSDDLSMQNCEIINSSSHGVHIYAYDSSESSAAITDSLLSENDGYGIFCESVGGSTSLHIDFAGDEILDNGGCRNLLPYRRRFIRPENIGDNFRLRHPGSRLPRHPSAYGQQCCHQAGTGWQFHPSIRGRNLCLLPIRLRIVFA